MENFWQITQAHRKQNANHDRFAAVKNAACRLSFRSINSERMFSFSKRTKGRYTLSSPASIRPYQASVRDAFKTAARFTSHKRDCNALSWSEHKHFIALTRDMRKQRAALTKLTKNRRQNFKWSTTFAVELAPLPFKVEFIEGSAKLKITKSIGPLKFDVQTGPKRRQRVRNDGADYLVVRTPDHKARVFYVRGKDLDIDFPAVNFKKVGASLIFTCTKACMG